MVQSDAANNEDRPPKKIGIADNTSLPFLCSIIQDRKVLSRKSNL